MCISYLELLAVKDILKRTASFLVPFFYCDRRHGNRKEAGSNMIRPLD